MERKGKAFPSTTSGSSLIVSSGSVAIFLARPRLHSGAACRDIQCDFAICQSGSLHDEKLPYSYSPTVLPSVLKHLSSETVESSSSSSLVATQLEEEQLSRIDDVFVNFGEKSNNWHIALRHKEIISSSHHSLRSRSYTQCSFTRASLRRALSICRLCFGFAMLGAHACISGHSRTGHTGHMARLASKLTRLANRLRAQMCPAGISAGPPRNFRMPAPHCSFFV